MSTEPLRSEGQPSHGSWEWLRHPMILLLATALISGLMVPYFTSGWQLQKKQAELETVLIGEMSQAVVEIIMASQFAFLGSSSQSKKEFDDAYRRWEISQAVLRAKILAIERNPATVADWDTFADRITMFYATLGYRDPKGRRDYERSLRDLTALAQPHVFECDASTHNDRLGASTHSDKPPEDQKYERAWDDARSALLMDLGRLINCVLEPRGTWRTAWRILISAGIDSTQKSQ